MINISVQNHQARINIDQQVSVHVTLEPFPAEKVTVGYTHLAWVWCAVNNALETAKIDLAFGDSYEIACQISEKLLTADSALTEKNAHTVLPFMEVE